MKKTTLLEDGKNKRLFATENPDLAVLEFKDDATAYNAPKKGVVIGRGIVHNKMSGFLFRLLEKRGIPTHFVKELSERDMLIKRAKMFPIELRVRNIAGGRLSRRMGLAEGTRLGSTVLEFYYKNGEAEPPLVNEYHLYVGSIMTDKDYRVAEELALRANRVLCDAMLTMGLEVADIKFSLGRFNGNIIITGELSLASFRFWDAKSGKKLDKAKFRRDLGAVSDAHQEILNKLMGQ